MDEPSPPNAPNAPIPVAEEPAVEEPPAVEPSAPPTGRDGRTRRRLRIAVVLTLVAAVIVLGVLQRIGAINLRGGPSPAQPASP